MELGVMVMPRLESAEHIALAEQLGYDFAVVADSNTFLADPWITLALAARNTSRIRLTPGAITPRMRHVVANAGAAATLAHLAPHRTQVLIGSGFTSQAMIGKPAATWREVEAYVVALRALLRGEETTWDDELIALPFNHLIGISLPQEVPILIAAHGPKGYAAAERVGDGVVTNPMHGVTNDLSAHRQVIVQVNGTVLKEGEGYDSPRVFEAAGPAAAMQLHLGDGGAARGMAESAGFAAKLESVDPRHRHLVVHRSHFVEVTDFEREYVTPDLIRRCTDTGTPDEWRERLDKFQASGVTGVMLAVAGSDIPRELDAFAKCFNSRF